MICKLNRRQFVLITILKGGNETQERNMLEQGGINKNGTGIYRNDTRIKPISVDRNDKTELIRL